eukprot:6491414-Amphidinium_carterae.1
MAKENAGYGALLVGAERTKMSSASNKSRVPAMHVTHPPKPPSSPSQLVLVLGGVSGECKNQETVNHPKMLPFKVLCLELFRISCALLVGLQSRFAAASVSRLIISYPHKVCEMPRKCSVEQLAAKAVKEQDNARKHMHAARKARVNVLMAENPSLVQAILDSAEEIVAKNVQAPEQPLQAPRGSAKPAAVPDLSTREAALQVEIDRHAHKVGKLSLDDLKCLLFEINEYRFSPFQLKALKEKSHQRDVSKETLCKVLQFVTTVGAETELGTGFFRTRADVLAYIRLQRAQLGGTDRSAVLPLPPDWAQHGVFRVTEATVDHILVMHKFSGLVVTVPNSQHENLIWDVADLPNIMVEQNWADLQAKIVVRGTPKGAMLHRFFQLDGKLVSRQLALQAHDGASGSVVNDDTKRKRDDNDDNDDDANDTTTKRKMCGKMAAFMQQHSKKGRQQTTSSQSTSSRDQGTPSTKSEASGDGMAGALDKLLAESEAETKVGEMDFAPPPPDDE